MMCCKEFTVTVTEAPCVFRVQNYTTFDTGGYAGQMGWPEWDGRFLAEWWDESNPNFAGYINEDYAINSVPVRIALYRNYGDPNPPYFWGVVICTLADPSNEFVAGHFNPVANTTPGTYEAAIGFFPEGPTQTADIIIEAC